MDDAYRFWSSRERNMDLAGLVFEPAVDILDTAIDERRRKQRRNRNMPEIVLIFWRPGPIWINSGDIENPDDKVGARSATVYILMKRQGQNKHVCICSEFSRLRGDQHAMILKNSENWREIDGHRSRPWSFLSRISCACKEPESKQTPYPPYKL